MSYEDKYLSLKKMIQRLLDEGWYLARNQHGRPEFRELDTLLPVEERSR